MAGDLQQDGLCGVGVEIPESGGIVVPVPILTAVVFVIGRAKRGERT